MYIVVSFKNDHEHLYIWTYYTVLIGRQNRNGLIFISILMNSSEALFWIYYDWLADAVNFQ